MKTKQQLIDEIGELADKMIALGGEIEYFAGLDCELARHGTEMIGAGLVASGWADGMEAE